MDAVNWMGGVKLAGIMLFEHTIPRHSFCEQCTQCQTLWLQGAIGDDVLARHVTLPWLIFSALLTRTSTKPR